MLPHVLRLLSGEPTAPLSRHGPTRNRTRSCSGLPSRTAPAVCWSPSPSTVGEFDRRLLVTRSDARHEPGATWTPSDADRMRQAMAAAAGVAPHRVAPAVGRVPWCVPAGAPRRPSGLRRRHPGPRGPPRRGRRPRRRPAPAARGATLYVTLEPCAHHGARPSSCADAVIDGRGQPGRGGRGRSRPPGGRRRASPALRAAGHRASRSGVGRRRGAPPSCGPTSHHRRTGRPCVVLKLAASLDGRTAAPDGTSQWITGAEARLDAHRLRADSDAVLVGAGTVRADDPALTVRLPAGELPDGFVPARCGSSSGPRRPAPQVQPALELRRRPRPTCSTSWAPMGVLQVLVEGGASVAHGLHQAGLVDRYVLYLAPMLFGGDDARGLFAGAGRDHPGRRLARRRGRRPAPRRRSAHRPRPPAARRDLAGGSSRRPIVPNRVVRSLTMFTGIVEELGRSPPATARACASTPRTVLDGAALGDSTAVNGCCLTVVAFDADAGWWEADVTDETYARTSLGDLGAGRSGQPRAAGPPRGPARRPSRAGPRRRRRPDRRRRRPTCGSACPTTLLRYVVEKGSITVDGDQPDGGRRARRRLHRRRRSRTPTAVTTLGHKGAGRSGQPRGRRDGQVHRAPAGRPARAPLADRRPQPSRRPGVATEESSVTVKHDTREGFATIPDAIAAIAPGRDRRGGRRRGPRERGRPHHGGRVGHPREDRLLRAPHLGRDLRAADRRAARRARHPADGARQHRGPAHRVHLQRRLPPRHLDRHLGRRPGGHHPRR